MKILNLAEKVDLIRASEVAGTKQSDLVKRFNASKSQVSRILKNKRAILDEFDSYGTNRKRQRNRSGRDEEVGDALLLWFREKMAQGARLDGALLREKANELAQEKGSDFRASGKNELGIINHCLNLCALQMAGSVGGSIGTTSSSSGNKERRLLQTAKEQRIG